MKSAQVFWQAHRGGGLYEAPDNTMAAMHYAWELGGIPEADIRTTSDGIIICLHDNTLARTTTAPESIKDQPVADLTFEQIRLWDAGNKFSEKFAGQKVPSLAEVLAEMKGKPERLVYLDLKKTDLVQLGALIDEYEVNAQVIFAHKVLDNCQRMKHIADGVRSMLWIGGNAEQIKEKFNAVSEIGFPGLDQVQLHLNPNQGHETGWPYEVDLQFLSIAMDKTRKQGIDLEVFPMSLDEVAMHQLLEIGIRWYATDEPSLFLQYINSWSKS